MTSEPKDSSTPDPSDAREELAASPAGSPSAPDTVPAPIIGDPEPGSHGTTPQAPPWLAAPGQAAPGQAAPGQAAPGQAAPGQAGAGRQAAPQPHWSDSVSLDAIPRTPAAPRRPRTTSVPLGRSGETVYHTSAVYGRRSEPEAAPQPKRRPLAVKVGGGVVVVVAVALVLMLTVFKSGNNKAVTGFVPTGSSPQADAQQLATAFLTAWQSGDLGKAADYTDQPATAQAALAAYSKDLNLSKLTATAGTIAGAPASTAARPRENVTFEVNAGIASSSAAGAPHGTWTYHSALVAYQQPNSTAWLVAWQPSVLAPNLTASQHLAAFTVPPTVSLVTDAAGQALKKYKDPGLDTIAGLLAASPPTNEGVNPGLGVQIVNANGKPVAGSQGPIVAAGNYPTLSTTINPQAEAAAQTSVAMHKQSSMVVIQPSTGRILAIANNAGFNDFALTADVAPGSTMKIITSTALFNAGLATANTPVGCPAVVTVTSNSFHNDNGETLPPSTPLTTDFAQSCNNAFSQWWPKLGGKLASTAKDYYGLNQKWNIGIGGMSASYFNAPADAVGSELAQEAFGQGQLIASPLAMASVAATVDTGTFKQPVLTLSAKQVTASPLPAATDAGLKQMMRAVVTQGTAAGIGLGPNVYAKTGTADIKGQGAPNSWLVAFDPTKDVAVGCLVVNAGFGAAFAGPEVAAFLNSYQP